MLNNKLRWAKQGLAGATMVLVAQSGGCDTGGDGAGYTGPGPEAVQVTYVVTGQAPLDVRYEDGETFGLVEVDGVGSGWSTTVTLQGYEAAGLVVAASTRDDNARCVIRSEFLGYTVEVDEGANTSRCSASSEELRGVD